MNRVPQLGEAKGSLQSKLNSVPKSKALDK